MLDYRNKIVPSAILIISMVISGGSLYDAAFGVEENNNGDNEKVSISANFEMIKGHIENAIANKAENELDLAKSHSSHPIAEHYAIVEPDIDKSNSALNTVLKSSLTDLSENTELLDLDQFKTQTEEIFAMLDQASNETISEDMRNDLKFNVNVINTLLLTAAEEYGEAVKAGEIVEIIEYQDAQAFINRAESRLDNILNGITGHSKMEVQEFFEDLKTSIQTVQSPDDVSSLINGIVNELQGAVGISQDAGSITSMQYVTNIRDMLNRLSAEYEAGNYSEADKLAVQAYLDNFEHIEGDLESAGKTELMEEIEELMRVQLRQKIQDRVSVDELNSHIDTINSKLSEAESVLQ